MSRKQGYNSNGAYKEQTSSGNILLTNKQRLFLEYFNGNADQTYEALKGLGIDISKMECTLYAKDPGIRLAVQARAMANDFVVTKRSRQSFWSRVMADESEDMKNRLKASELLGKSEKDFIERVEHTIEDDFADALERARNRAIKAREIASKFEEALE